MRPISSTTPRVSSIVTSSPSRTGWGNAISSPATKFPSVRCEAKPTMIPSTAEEARRPPATARTSGMMSSADRIPTTITAALTLRRRTRYRVIVPLERSRRAIRRSINRAATAVNRRTAARTTRRCQYGMGFQFDGLHRFPSGEAFVDGVPEGHFGLAHLPAEQNVFAATLGREVEQSLVEVLHLHTRGVDAPDALDEGVCCAHDLLGSFANLPRREVAAVRGDPRHELRLPSVRLD